MTAREHAFLMIGLVVGKRIAAKVAGTGTTVETVMAHYGAFHDVVQGDLKTCGVEADAAMAEAACVLMDTEQGDH